MDNKKEFYKKFEDRIWITYKSRINAYDRIKRDDRDYNFILTLYSISLLVGSVLNLKTCDDGMNIMLTLLSIVVTCLVLYVNSQKFKERCFALKQNYIDLGTLKDQMKTCNSDEEYQKINYEYNKVMSNVENHEECDYLKVLFNTKDEKMKGLKIIVFIFAKIKYVSIRVFLFSPLVYIWFDFAIKYVNYIKSI